MPRPSTLGEYQRIQDAVVAYIAQWYWTDITLDDFCKESRYSRRSVQRALKHHDTSWRYLLLDRRMGAASEFIKEPLNSNITIAKISEEAGYKQPAHFAKVFRSYFGMNPSEYRQMSNGEVP